MPKKKWSGTPGQFRTNTDPTPLRAHFVPWGTGTQPVPPPGPGAVSMPGLWETELADSRNPDRRESRSRTGTPGHAGTGNGTGTADRVSRELRADALRELRKAAELGATPEGQFRLETARLFHALSLVDGALPPPTPGRRNRRRNRHRRVPTLEVAIRNYYWARRRDGAAPEDISGPDAADATGASEQHARNVLAMVRKQESR